ncbi:hypothetical protein F5Y19DRAFT_323623 [Xylariaceae sp. FL1651]|nr:hypothetical protein F5Y19DRAFT_323623 [Xylariaceae sp. FL1651]
MRLYSPFAMSRLPVPTRWAADSENGGLRVLLALAPIVVPAAYVVYVLRQGARRTSASTRISPPDPLVGESRAGTKGSDATARAGGTAMEDGDTAAIPPAVLAEREQHVIARERVVSDAVPLESICPSLRPGGRDDGSESARKGLLETYLSNTMRLFTWTPQAFVMKSMVSRLPRGAEYAATFSAPYLDSCRFEVGDRVCGVYVVRERVSQPGGERVFLDLSPPVGWTGPVVDGVLDCGFVLGKGEGGEPYIRFVNETLLWRRKEDRPTLLEGKAGRWLHALMVRWMVVRGVEAVTGVNEKI